nr:phospholipase-like protein [Tanacetum cinerariifolium]
DEERFGKLSDDDTIRLCLLLALEVIFMGQLLTFKVDDTLFRLVKNLEACNLFPWDYNYVPTYTLSGFVFAFQDYLREEELRLCLEDEETLRCEHEKLIVNENRFRLDEANRNFWLKLVYLDPARKGWLTEKHIDLWVDYMWHVRTEYANWAMVSCYFVQLLLQKGMPLFYANGERYTTPWSEVDQVFVLINETGEHWCLAQFHILSGDVTFYDIEDTYDYEYRDWHEQIVELQSLVGSNVAAESVMLLKEFQHDVLESSRGLMRLICETQLKLLGCLLSV